MPRYLLTASALFCASSTMAATNCEGLAKLKLPKTEITLASVVAAGQFTPPPAFTYGLDPGDVAYTVLPEFCRVAATLRPTKDSVIKFEVWLPTAAAWNIKFMAVGNGAQGGQIFYHKMGLPLTLGYAIASTDTGHEGDRNDASYSLGHPEKVIDFGYRSIHEMTVKSKAIIAAYYSRNAKFSYWNGCSTGGRQGLADMQRYPGDFDGVIAGAPANNPHAPALRLWITQAVHKDAASYIPPEKFPVIHRAVLQACDTNDGVRDGVIEDPRRCTFDLQTITCKGPDRPDCLNFSQAEAARKIYGPVLNPRTGEKIYPGFEPGSELGWGFSAGQEPPKRTVEDLQNRVFKDPNWDYKTFNFDSDVLLLEREGKDRDAIDPNLKPFFKRGGKLLQYHGWSDSTIPPQNSIDYYESVRNKLGSGTKLNDSYRLFMVPGMAHCRDGEGTDRFDVISILEQWVENGKAPESISAARYAGENIERTRPLCPYPQTTVYKGTGSTDDAANFACRTQ